MQCCFFLIRKATEEHICEWEVGRVRQAALHSEADNNAYSAPTGSNMEKLRWLDYLIFVDRDTKEAAICSKDCRRKKKRNVVHIHHEKYRDG